MKLQASLNSSAAADINIGSNAFKITPGKQGVQFNINDSTVYIEGEFYYCKKNGTTKKITAQNATEMLSNLFSEFSVDQISKVLEGMYCGIVYDKKIGKISAFSDAFNRKNFFYTKVADEFILSTSLNEVIEHRPTLKYDQKGLYSYLLLGYPPIKNTFYEDVFRLGSDEVITFDSKGIAFISTSQIVNIEQYEKSKIDEYDKAITNSVLSRASDAAGGNIVMNSGGWDSTSLVYLLTRHYDKKDVRSVVFEVKLSDGQSFNIYEVDKVKRISKHFGIDTEVCTIDYSNKESIDIWERNLQSLQENHVYFWIHHIKLAEQVGGKTAAGASVFSGEASDSIHNFGYSQFVSVNYDEMYLREYADKMKSYLYGPSFLGKINSGEYIDDKVFQFFNYYYGKEKFDLPNNTDIKDTLNKYFQAFILSYPRVPFAKWKNATLVKDAFVSNYEKFLNENYFNKLSNSVSPDNLYYHLLQIYKDFHFQSAQIHIANVAFSKYHLSCRMPFLDMEMVNYMYSMPEDWGRGLEIRTTKYPLRYLANERWDGMPLHILEENGPHSYIAENDKKWTYAGGNWDIYCEILYSSVFADYFKDMFAKINIEDYFSQDSFEVSKFKKVIQDYLDGVQDIPNHGLLFRLALLVSIGLIKK